MGLPAGCDLLLISLHRWNRRVLVCVCVCLNVLMYVTWQPLGILISISQYYECQRPKAQGIENMGQS